MGRFERFLGISGDKPKSYFKRCLRGGILQKSVRLWAFRVVGFGFFGFNFVLFPVFIKVGQIV